MGTLSSKQPSLSLIAAMLLIINGLIWLIFGALTLISGRHYEIAGINVYVVLGLLSFGNGVALIGAGWGIQRRVRIAKWGAVVLLIANAVLSLTDEIGVFDVTIFALNIITLIVILASWRRLGSIGADA